ncbi:hypothetical protein [Aerococcus christensenii]|uniref:Uncharacterized protein n=1 Tax=Aerococcus christensenii TaxID=87541 RepID=A0A133XTS6_9LACT|nr:hypothetical protein [Aerococcus christensenii]KXB34333.1 hypothetical protein HMPREF3187_01412 [Aerococcus christensenii]MDK8233491.1 hypothetical protein [Aerococcus christensenii]
MRYLTGIYAFNIPCSLETSGDWHWGALNWKQADFKESTSSFYGNYGISQKPVSTPIGAYYVANHIRAFLDLLVEGKFSVVRGSRKEYFGNEKYTLEILNKVYELKGTDNWEAIAQFISREYGLYWQAYLILKGDKYDERLARKTS